MVMDRSRSTSSGRSGSSAKKASSSGSSSSGRAPAFPSLFDASNMFAAAHWLQDPLMGQLASMSGSSQSQAQAASLAAAGLNPLAAAGYPPSLFSSSSTPSTTTTATSSNSKENSAAVMAAAANQWYAMAASQLAAQEYYARLGLAPDPLLAASLDHMISAQNALLKQQQKSSSSNSSSNRQRIPSSSPTKTSKTSPSPSATLTSAQHAALIAAGLGASMLGAPPQKTPATSSPSPRTTSSMSSVTSVSDSLRNLEELAGVKRSASSSVMGSTATSKADNAFPKATGSTPSSLIDFTTPSVSKRPRTSTTTSSSSTDPKKKGAYSDVLLGKNIPGLTISVIGNGQSGNAVSLEPTDLSVKKAATNGPVSPASDGPLDLCMKPGKEKDRGAGPRLRLPLRSPPSPFPSPPAAGSSHNALSNQLMALFASGAAGGLTTRELEAAHQLQQLQMQMQKMMEGASASTDSLSRSSGSSSRKSGSSSHKSRSSLNGPISSLDKQNSQAAAALASLSSQFAAAMASVPASSSQKGNLHTSKPLGRGQSRPKKNTVASLLATRKASATSARDSPGPTGMGDSLTSPGFPLGTPGGDLKTHDPTTSALLIAAVSGTSSSTYPSSATPLEGEPGAEEDLDDTHSEGGDSSVAGSDMTSLSSSSAVPRKRRKTSAEDSVVQVPLVSGWRRETMIRSIQNSGIRGEVTYYSPDNKKFKQYPELLRYLERNGITNFGREHFSFSLRVIAGEYLYPTGDGNVLTLTAQEMEAQLEEMRAHTAVGNASRAEKMRERRREEKEIQHRIIEELKKDNRPVTEDEVARRIQEWKAERRHERELVREREREQRRQQMEEARRQREKERAEWAEQQKKEKEDKAKEAAKEKELKRQQAILLQEQAAQLYMQELTKQREYLLTQEMDRERRRQHMILIKALEGRKKAEEKEKRRREADREKQLQRDRRLQRRSFELEILRELRRGVDDMALTKDSKELPQLQRLPGLKLSGEAFADVQMIYEFLHNFGETLGFDMDSLPSLLHLQLAFLNQSSCEDELLSILTHLLVCAIEDPGIPHPNRHTTLFGQTLKQADITPANASEIMRIYLYANATGEVKALMGIAPDKKDIIVEKSPEFLDLIEENQAYQLSQLLVDRPYLSLSPEQKAKIVSYICHELLLNKAVVKQVDATVERLNSARRDKWAVEVRLRRARSASAHYRRTPVSSGKAPCAAAASLRAMSLAEDDLFLDDSSLLMTPSADGGAGGEKGAESDSEHPSVPVDNDRSSTPQATGNSASTQVAPPTPSSITETAGDEASVSSAPASCAATPQPSEESNKELEALEKQYETACRDLWDTQLQLRGLRLGEDRYKRTYWLCRRGGGILVEGMESGSPVEFGVGEMFGDTDDQEDEEESAVIKKEEVLSEGGVEAVKKEVDEPDEGIGMNGEEGPGSSSTGSDLKEGTTYLNGQKLSSTEEEEEMLRLWLQESAPAVKKKETPTANQGESKANGFSEEDDKKDVKMKKEEVDQPWFFLLPRSPCERNSLLCPPPSAEDDPEDSQQPQNGESEQLTAEEEADIRECLRTLAPASAAVGGGPPSVPIATLSKISSFATNPPRRDAVMAIVQTPPKRKKIPEDCRTGWWRITSADQLAALISSLNHHGIRERELKREIIRHKDTILAELEKPIPQESLLLPAADEEMEESDHLQPLVDSPRGPWARDVALRIDLGTLDQVLELEEKVHAASMQVKFWKPPPRLSTEDESRFRPSCEEGGGGGGGRGAGKLLNPVAVARERLLELETMIERRYITAPLGSSGGEILLHSINKAQNSIVTSSAVAASSPSPSPVTPCGGGASPVVSGSVEATPTGTEDGRDVERRSTPEKSVSSVGNSGSSETVTRALTQWREGLAQSTTAAQVAMALHMLQACIAWDKSIMKASCQFCHLGDNEAKLLLCDGCDRGYHTYCFKPEIEIPAGDWYCYECLNKATRRRHCLYCGGLGKNIASCDNCCKAYHADCHNPPLAKVPRGKWYCTSCASRNPRMAAVSAAAFSKRGRKPKTSTSGSSPSISSPAPAPSPSPLTQDKSPPPSVASNHSQSDDDSKKDRSNKKVSRDLGPLRTLLEELESHEDSWPFLLPVNTKQFPTYKKVIKMPMDLTTIKKKLETCVYKSREEFLFDVRLIFDNCETFNEDDSPVGKAGHNLRMAFESRWGEVMGTASPNANCSSNGSAPS